MKSNLAKLLLLVILGGLVIFFLTNKKTDDKIHIGILQPISHPALDDIKKGIMDELAANNYIDGKNVEYIFMNAEGNQVNMKTMSKKLVDDKADLLIGIGAQANQTLLSDTKDIPVVGSAVTDPVGNGLIKDPDHPDANFTAVSDVVPLEKQVQFMLQLKPNIKTLGVLSSSNDVNSIAQITMLKKALAGTDINIKEYTIAKAVELNQVVAKMAEEVDTVFITQDNLIASTMPIVIKITNQHKIPVFPAADSMVKDGGLATVSVTQYETGRVSGKMVLEVLSGKKIADIPVVFYADGQPMINTKAAAAIDFKIPEAIIKEVKENGVIL